MKKLPIVTRIVLQTIGWLCFVVAIFAPPNVGKGPAIFLYALLLCGAVSLLGVVAFLVSRRTIWRQVPKPTMFHTFAGYIYAFPISWFFIAIGFFIWASVRV